MLALLGRLKIVVERWIEEAKLSHLRGKLELSKVLLYVLASNILSEADKKEYVTVILEELGLSSSDLVRSALEGRFDVVEAFVANYMNEIHVKMRKVEEKLESLRLMEPEEEAEEVEVKEPEEESPLGS